MQKRFRDENGYLTIRSKELARLTLEEGNAYYLSGVLYEYQGYVYMCKRYQKNETEHVTFECINLPHKSFEADPASLGTLLPDVASEGFEFTKIEKE